MQTKQAIQTSANVVRITNISAGDVYKRFDDSYDDRVYFGLVTAVHNDGEKTIIEATEYRWNGYSTLEVDFKVLRGEKDYILFPSTPEELNLGLEEARKRKLRDIEEAERKILEAKRAIDEIDGLISGERQKSLKAMSYKELTQDEYNQRLQAIN